MTITRSHPIKAVASGVATLFRWVLAVLGFVFRLLLVTWATLVIYFSNLPWAWLRLVLAVAFAAFSIWALWLTCTSRLPERISADNNARESPSTAPTNWVSRGRMTLVFAALFLCVLVWFILIPASHERTWRSEVGVMPRVIIDGDRVRFTGYRNFDYRSRDDFTVRYEEREVLLSHLTSLDLFISYWSVGPVGHTFVSFNFDNAPPVCISIETRPEVGEGFAPVAS